MRVVIEWHRNPVGIDVEFGKHAIVIAYNSPSTKETYRLHAGKIGRSVYLWLGLVFLYFH